MMSLLRKTTLSLMIDGYICIDYRFRGGKDRTLLVL